MRFFVVVVVVGSKCVRDDRRVCPSSDNMLGCVLLQSALWNFVNFRKTTDKNKVSLNVCSIEERKKASVLSKLLISALQVACSPYCKSQNAEKK